jgi:hypothetical protein
MRRTQPDSVIVLNTAIPIACIFVILTAMAIKVFSDVPWPLTLEFIGGSLVVFAIWWWLFRR